MPKGDYQRNLRRIDYSKAEIADRLHITENSVDVRIKKLCEDYGLKKGFFKRDGDSGMNFFAPEFTPLLVSLLENEADNPDRKTKNKRKELTVGDVVNYNKKMQKSIMENQEIPDYMKSYIEELPFFRSSKDIVELMDIFVLEMEILIHNLFGTEGTDVGQALRQAIRMVDIANYNMFCGRERIKGLMAQNSQLQNEQEGKLMKELEAMTPEELADALQSPPIRAVYEMYKGKLKGEPLRQSIDAKDLSINQGILSVIRALMQQGGANKLKNCTTMDLPEYLNDENYKRLMEELARKEEDNPEVKGRELERNMYLKAHQRDIVCFLNNCCQCGTMEFVNRGKKWKPSYQLIKDGEKVEYQCQGMATMDFQGEFDKAYYEFCTEIKKEQNGLEDIVSNFLGRTITDYVFASKKK